MQQTAFTLLNQLWFSLDSKHFQKALNHESLTSATLQGRYCRPAHLFCPSYQGFARTPGSIDWKVQVGHFRFIGGSALLSSRNSRDEFGSFFIDLLSGTLQPSTCSGARSRSLKQLGFPLYTHTAHVTHMGGLSKKSGFRLGRYFCAGSSLWHSIQGSVDVVFCNL